MTDSTPTRTSATDAAPAAKAGRLTIAVAIGFALLFGYDLVEAITNLVGVPAQFAAANEFAAENDLAQFTVPWGILIANLLLPPVVFALAWWLGRGRSILNQALLFLMGLALVAALTLTLTALV